jgi:hypothetical protein
VSQPKKIDELLRRFMHTSGVKEASRIAGFRKAFEAAVGPEVAGQTRVCGLRNGELTVEVDGSALLAELSCFHQDTLIESINGTTSRERLRRIRFRLKGTGHV